MTELLKKAAALVSTRPPAGREFELQIGWSEDYDRLFRLEHEVESETTLLDRLLKRGRVILVGRGGSGKTFLMRRTARRAVARNILPIFIGLRNWKPADYESWTKWISKRGNGSGFLITQFARPATSFLELDLLPPTTQKVLLVDGLNEISEPVGQEVLVALEEFASTQIQASVLVSDRLIRRDVPKSWLLGKIMPLSADKIRRYGGARILTKPNAAILELPFYLDASLQHSGDASFDNAQTHQEFLTRHTGLANADLADAASAAFAMYEKGMTRTFSLEDFTQAAGQDVVAKLRAATILEVTGNTSQFAHHLIHDSLAAHHLATASETTWTAKNLDAITLRASSLDPIVLIFEQLPPANADNFLRRVYDWNLYAAGYALAERNPEHAGPSQEMEVVIFAMLAEKKLDQVLATALRAGDALSISRSPQATPFRSVTNLPQLLQAAFILDSEVNWFLAWRGVFTRPLGESATNQEVTALGEEDSIMGWTWANVLKRLLLTDDQQGILRSMLTQEITPTVQWRIVHVLGAFPSEANLEVLLRAVESDMDTNVRYGAARSLVEMASRANSNLRTIIIGGIKERREMFVENDIVLRELKRSLMIRPAVKPEGWEEVVLQLIREFYQHSEQPDVRDAWRKYALDVDTLYGTF